MMWKQAASSLTTSLLRELCIACRSKQLRSCLKLRGGCMRVLNRAQDGMDQA